MNYEKVASGLVVPKRAELIVGGFFIGQIIRQGEVIDEFESHNLIVNQGLDHILATEFTGGPQITSWYMAPYSNNYVPVGTDTAASFPGNAGENISYSGSGRVAYTAVESAQQVTNAAAAANFTFTATATIYGAMLISSSGFRSTSGTLFGASLFSAPKNIVANDQLLLTYAFGAASS